MDQEGRDARPAGSPRGIQLPNVRTSPQPQGSRPHESAQLQPTPRESPHNTEPPSRRLPLLAGLTALALLLAVAVIALPKACSSTTTDATESAQEETTSTTEEETPSAESSAADGPTSTPQDQWAQGNMPYLYQTDPQWADVEYAGGPLSTTGCGPTALAMVYIYLTGDTSLGPVEMAEFSAENGFAIEGSGTSWTLMTDGAAMLGLSSQILSAVPSQLEAELEAGHPVVCVMAPGTFTDVGHFIVLERMTSDGKVVVHDSNSVERSMRTWSLDLICSEAENIWSLSLS